MLKKEDLQYYDLRMAGDVNSRYHSFTNCEIARLPHTREYGKQSFAVTKRQGFKKTACDSACSVDLEGGIFTDRILIKTNNRDESYTEYFMWIHMNKRMMKILRKGRKSAGENVCCLYQVGKDQGISTTGYFKFITTQHVKGKPCSLYSTSTPGQNIIERDDAILANVTTYTLTDYEPTEQNYEIEFRKRILEGNTMEAVTEFKKDDGRSMIRTAVNNPPDGQLRLDEKPDNTTVGFLYGETTSTYQSVKIGNYIYAFANTKYPQVKHSGIPGQVGVVTGKILEKKTATLENQIMRLDIRVPRAGMFPDQYLGYDMRIRAYEDRGDVFFIDTVHGLKQWTYDMDGAYPYNNDDFISCAFSDQRSRSFDINNNIIVSINNKGYLRYGGEGTLLTYAPSEHTKFVGNDIMALTTFQQYTLLFRRDRLSVVKFDYDETGQITSDLKSTDLNVGIRSKDSYDLYRSNFYFFGSNKRLYSLTINPTVSGQYSTDIQDMSAKIKHEFEKILDTDLVYLQATEQDLKLFIVSDTRGNKSYVKTKILIFNKDYQFWHKREVCNCVLTGQSGEYYLGNGLYHNCGMRDGADCDSEGNKYTQKIDAYIGDNDVTEPPSLFQPKRLLETIMILGRNSVLTNGSFHYQLESFTNCLHPTFRLSNPEKICYVKMLNDFRAGTFTQPSTDMMRLLHDCDNLENPGDGSTDSEDILVDSELCNCPQVPKKVTDYCVTYNDKKYFIAPFSKIHVTNPEVRANTYKISILAQGDNVMEFMGMIIPYYTNNPEDKDIYCDGLRDCEDCKLEACICNTVLARECGC